MNTFKLITITHKTANINHIGQYIPTANHDKDALAKILKEVKTALNIDELLYLATCNRLTFLFVTEQEVDDLFIIDFFSRLHPDIPEVCLGGLLDVIARYEGIAGIQHLFSIAASLDSLVVGEREITRQLREAYDFCKKHQLTDDHIRLAIKMAIPVAKEIYTNTKIGENSVSVVALAMKALLKNHLPKNTRFLIVGAGTTNSTALKILRKYGYHNFHIFNRTFKNAQALAHKVGGQAYSLEQLKEYREGFDVLISCTGSTDAIITPNLYQSLLAGDGQPKIVIDLAVPNDIHPDVVRQFPLQYIEVEKLRFLAGQNLELRKNEVAKAEMIVSKRAEEFTAMLQNRKIEKAMASIIPHKVKAIKKRAMESVFQKEIEQMDEASRTTLDLIVNYLEKKYISIPIIAAKEIFLQREN
ncbi:MAG: glutamyl-tRNA reductase [Chitinophagales bacterium]